MKRKRATVKCAFCQMDFSEAVPGITFKQGWNCSGEVKEGKAFFGFGSMFDCDVWEVQTDLQGQICDSCLQQLIDKGRAMFISNSISQLLGCSCFDYGHDAESCQCNCHQAVFTIDLAKDIERVK